MITRLLMGGVLASSVAISGCATIIHGSTQPVGLSSSPTGAIVYVDGAKLGSTPVNLELKRNANHVVKFELDGYAPFEATLTRGLSGWVWGNIVFGGLIGLAVDAVSGSLYKLTPEQLQAELRTNGVSTLETGDKLVLAVVLKANPKWEKIGELEAIQ